MTSAEYWNNRYKTGGNSGPGSRGRLADFKAGILNAFVAEHGIDSVIEFGCGDGHQLALASYPGYTGFDVSEVAVERCREAFAGHKSKRFALMADYNRETADVAMSLDVIYHLLEDDVFEAYMATLFGAARRFVVIYSTNYEREASQHCRHHKFTRWVEENAKGWKLSQRIPNRYPYQGDGWAESDADFYIYAN
jgi:SAM-dependent methyltransferase